MNTFSHPFLSAKVFFFFFIWSCFWLSFAFSHVHEGLTSRIRMSVLDGRLHVAVLTRRLPRELRRKHRRWSKWVAESVCSVPVCPVVGAILVPLDHHGTCTFSLPARPSSPTSRRRRTPPTPPTPTGTRIRRMASTARFGEPHSTLSVFVQPYGLRQLLELQGNTFWRTKRLDKS